MARVECRFGDPSPLERKGIGAVLECLGFESRLSDPVGDVGSLLRELLPGYISLSEPRVEFAENEPLGTNYILYKYHVYDGNVFVSSCRAVVRRMVLEEVVCTIDSSQRDRVPPSPASTREEPRLSGGAVGRGPPPGQFYIDNFVVYRILGTPLIDVGSWRLRVFGRVKNPLELTLDDLERLPRVTLVRDFHCVTGWAGASVGWEGVRLRLLAEMAEPLGDARWVYATSLDGYSTIIPLEDFLSEDSLLVLGINGKRLTVEQGFPARLFIPHLYGWKSIKWVRGLEFLSSYRDGYWEALGYHERGNVFMEERFKSSRLRVSPTEPG